MLQLQACKLHSQGMQALNASFTSFTTYATYRLRKRTLRRLKCDIVTQN
jgi:hypothetical protein